jgi:hypothetical protein
MCGRDARDGEPVYDRRGGGKAWRAAGLAAEPRSVRAVHGGGLRCGRGHARPLRHGLQWPSALDGAAGHADSARGRLRRPGHDRRSDGQRCEPCHRPQRRRTQLVRPDLVHPDGSRGSGDVQSPARQLHRLLFDLPHRAYSGAHVVIRAFAARPARVHQVALDQPRFRRRVDPYPVARRTAPPPARCPRPPAHDIPLERPGTGCRESAGSLRRGNETADAMTAFHRRTNALTRRRPAVLDHLVEDVCRGRRVDATISASSVIASPSTAMLSM